MRDDRIMVMSFLVSCGLRIAFPQIIRCVRFVR